MEYQKGRPRKNSMIWIWVSAIVFILVFAWFIITFITSDTDADEEFNTETQEQVEDDGAATGLE